jgi:hypothetical protein
MIVKNLKTKTTFLLLCTFCFQFACTTNRYRQPISKLQAASAVVSANARIAYGESNRLNRTLEIKRLTRAGQFITKPDLEKVQFFDEEDLQARFDALDRLNDYVDLLVSIANSDAPENISKSAQDLTGALSNLTNTLAGLQNANFPNSTFGVKTQNAFGVTSVIVSEILKAFVQRKIKKGLEVAILKGEQPINELIDALSNDLTTINGRYVERFFSERNDIQGLYNCEANKVLRNPEITDCKADASPFSQQVLNGYRDQIISYEDTLETLRAANPRESLNKMKKAHIKIVTLAKSKNPANFAEAVAAIEDFANAAKRLGDAVDKLKNS